MKTLTHIFIKHKKNKCVCDVTQYLHSTYTAIMLTTPEPLVTSSTFPMYPSSKQISKSNPRVDLHVWIIIPGYLDRLNRFPSVPRYLDMTLSPF